jgi:hypothetical protein
MTKQLGNRGRDAVLHEKQQPRQHFIHQHRQRQALWEKVVGYFASWNRPDQNPDETEMSKKVNANRGQNDLELIFTKLKDCCDEGETELKEAIKYGLKIISTRKKPRSHSKTEDHASHHNPSNQEDHPLINRH